MTSSIAKRLNEHQTGYGKFTNRYGIKSLVYFERHATVPLAIQREKNIKH